MKLRILMRSVRFLAIYFNFVINFSTKEPRSLKKKWLNSEGKVETQEDDVRCCNYYYFWFIHSILNEAVPMHSGRGLSQWPSGWQVSTDEPKR